MYSTNKPGIVDQYTLDTEVSDEVIQHTLKNKSHVLSQWLMQMQEKNTILALKELGWTPPVDSSKSCIYEIGCSALQTGHCAMSHCPKFTERH